MNYRKLEKNIIDVIKEQQAKLGYMKEKVRLYYPLSSLNHFFGTEESEEGMRKVLEGFCACVRDRLGDVEVAEKDGRFCFLIPETGAEYVHNLTGENDFITELVNMVREHGCTIGQIIELFRSYSDRVCFKETDNGEFDYLIRFEDDLQDEYVYCFKDEGCYMTYHRFLREDYEEFGFESQDGEEE
ncbi:MAG TPA: DUF3877 family protein [Candidatus Mediterraneibacter intestinipullorum]|nr:DUF3877 family protein [Candidatus Mediterraneibacter intestinipullorum]